MPATVEQLRLAGILREHRARLRALEASLSVRGGAIDYNKDNLLDAEGNIGNWLVINPTGDNPSGSHPYGDGADIALLNDVNIIDGGNGGIQIWNNNDGPIILQNSGGQGIHIENDGGIDPDSGFGYYVEENGAGIYMLSTSDDFFIENNGGGLQLTNADEGVIIFSTGQFVDGFITDMPAFQPGMLIASSDGILFSQHGPTFVHDGPPDPGPSWDGAFLYMDTGDFGILALWAPVVLAQTSDPGHPGMLWNDLGTVKISL